LQLRYAMCIRVATHKTGILFKNDIYAIKNPRRSEQNANMKTNVLTSKRTRG
jgi:hypothetical protein